MNEPIPPCSRGNKHVFFAVKIKTNSRFIYFNEFVLFLYNCRPLNDINCRKLFLYNCQSLYVVNCRKLFVYNCQSLNVVNCRKLFLYNCQPLNDVYCFCRIDKLLL